MTSLRLVQTTLLLLLSSSATIVQAKSSKKGDDKPTCPEISTDKAIRIFGNEYVDFSHYLVRRPYARF
jgi:hypothetical protein